MCAFFHGLRHGRGAHSIHRPFPKRGYLFWGEKAIIAISLYVPGRLRRAARTGCTKTAVSLKRGGAAWADKRACALFCSADGLSVWQASACAAENLQRLCPAARACGAALLAESGADNTAGGFFVKAETSLAPLRPGAGGFMQKRLGAAPRAPERGGPSEKSWACRGASFCGGAARVPVGCTGAGAFGALVGCAAVSGPAPCHMRRRNCFLRNKWWRQPVFGGKLEMRRRGRSGAVPACRRARY